MLMLLDSAGLYYRAFHGVPESITAPDGTPVNAVRGFLDMCTALVSSRRPSGLVACWDDDWRPQWRVDLLASYKAHRVAADGAEDEPEALGVQVAIIAEVLAALGIARVGAPDFEADDVIATLARRHAARGEPVEVVTGDRDLIQLVDDATGVRVLYTGRGIRRVEVLDEAAVVAAHGVLPQQYSDLAILRGDPSDGLPGVPGIGAKTAAGLLARFGDMQGILLAIEADGSGVSPRIAASLRDNRDYLARAEQVVRAADVPLAEVQVAIPDGPAEASALAALTERWGLGAPIERFQDTLAQSVSDSPG
ncbi:MAG TPA: 5'-3' exonuclease H3TH domain-containing protein [Motilibacterales bacterium]|nr:5'-3' exonuclease H3TH domain-containing protein [Motilibacterales bacterium]